MPKWRAENHFRVHFRRLMWSESTAGLPKLPHSLLIYRTAQLHVNCTAAQTGPKTNVLCSDDFLTKIGNIFGTCCHMDVVPWKFTKISVFFFQFFQFFMWMINLG